MSKELEAWQEIKLGYICGQGAINEFALRENERENFKIIETALKNYEELTSRPVILYRKTHAKSKAIIDTICKNYKEVKITNLVDEKKLKALEIIIKHSLIIDDLLSCLEEEHAYWDYHWQFEYSRQDLTREEYELLKEVLL